MSGRIDPYFRMASEAPFDVARGMTHILRKWKSGTPSYTTTMPRTCEHTHAGTIEPRDSFSLSTASAFTVSNGSQEAIGFDLKMAIDVRPYASTSWVLGMSLRYITVS